MVTQNKQSPDIYTYIEKTYLGQIYLGKTTTDKLVQCLKQKLKNSFIRISLIKNMNMHNNKGKK